MIIFLVLFFTMVIWFALLFLKLEYMGENMTGTLLFSSCIKASWDIMLGENDYSF